jgi:F-type H+-transporting ATPase subunit b
MLTTLTMLASAEAEQKTGLAALGIDPKAILLQLITFVLLFVLLKKFAFTAIVKKLEERETTINRGLNLTSQMEEQQLAFDKKMDVMLHDARAEADRIIADSHAEAGKVMQAADESSRRKTDAMLADAHAKIDMETKVMRKGLTSEIADLVIAATSSIIGEKMDAQKDSALISKAIASATTTPNAMKEASK